MTALSCYYDEIEELPLPDEFLQYATSDWALALSCSSEPLMVLRAYSLLYRRARLIEQLYLREEAEVLDEGHVEEPYPAEEPLFPEEFCFDHSALECSRLSDRGFQGPWSLTLNPNPYSHVVCRLGTSLS